MWSAIKLYASKSYASNLEQAVLVAIALQVPKAADALTLPRQQVRVTVRENTGAEFTSLDISSDTQIEIVSSPCAMSKHDLRSEARNGYYAVAFGGQIKQLEGYSYEESTFSLDFERVAFGTAALAADCSESQLGDSRCLLNMVQRQQSKRTTPHCLTDPAVSSPKDHLPTFLLSFYGCS